MLRSTIALVVLAVSVLGASSSHGDCEPSPDRLCLQDGRFEVALEWRDPYNGGSGPGRAVALTDWSGYFWFFNPSNLEIVVKVLDGRPVNNRFWVFVAALSTVEFWLDVTDTESGLARRYHNPPFVQGSLTDVDAFDPALTAGSLLWIGAHPDDELLIAPWLGWACGQQARHCSLLVATRGESGECRIPTGCGSDLGAWRSAEMAAAAADLSADLVQWSLTDRPAAEPAAVRAAWAAESGGEEELLSRLATAIATAEADAVVTFDPRHGSTCHADHRALGELVLAALARLGPSAPPAWLVETEPDGSPYGTFEGYVAALSDDRLLSFDGTRPLPTIGDEAWQMVPRLAAFHRSQFTAPALTQLAAPPAARRRAFLLPAEGFGIGNPPPPGFCGAGP